jgi:hypothetical protein
LDQVRRCEKVLTRFSEIGSLIQARDAALPRYARASCLELATKVTKLPQELRDMVYHFLLDRKVRESIDVRVIREIGSHFIPTELGPLPHVFDFDFVGPNIASDLARRFAKMFKMRSIRIRLLELSFVESTDIRCLGLPFTDFTKQIKILVSYSQVLEARALLRAHNIHGKSSYWPSARRVLLNTLVRKVEMLLKGLGRGGLIKIVDGGIDKCWISNIEAAMYDSFMEDLLNELGVEGSWIPCHGDAQRVVYGDRRLKVRGLRIVSRQV